VARRPTFWISRVRRRPASFIWLLTLSAIAMVLSVLAPLLVRSVDQVTLAQAVERAGSDSTAMIAASNVSGGSAEVGLASVADVLGTIHGSMWGPARAAIDSATAYSWSGANGLVVHEKTGIGAPATSACLGATFVSGRCPRADGEVAVGRGTAGGRVKVGESITLQLAPTSTFKVVGIYDDRSAAGAFLRSPSGVAGEGGLSASPNLVVSVHEFDHLGLDGDAYSVRFLRRTVRLQDLPGLRTDILRAQAATLTAGSPESATRFTAGMQGVVNRLGPQQDAAAILLAVAALEALGLAWFAEALVVQRIGRSRAVEWGLARLRGLPRRRWLASIFVEPAVAVIVGSAVGVVVGIAVAHMSAIVLLGPTAVVDPAQPIVIGAAALSVVGSLVALVAASVRSARLPLSVLLRETAEPRMLSRLALVGQTVIVLLAIVVIYSLVSETQISGPQLAVLAPVVIAVLVGIVALRIAIALIRRVTRKAPKSLNGLLVGRQLGRAPSALYVAVMVTMGLAIVTYSAQTAAAADRLQDNRASADVGASQALTVSVPSDVGFVQAVRRADPSGTEAMAVEVRTSGSDAARLIALDTSRIQAVSSWLPTWSGMSATQLRAKLAPPTAASMTITGTQISISLAKVTWAAGVPDQTGPFLTMVVQNASGWHSVSFGPPHDGTLVSAPHEVPCSAGCRVVWIGESREGSGAPPFSTTMTITGFSTDKQPASDLSTWLSPDKWRNRIGDGSNSDVAPGAILSSRAGGLGVAFFGSGGDTASIATNDAPDPLPALVGPVTQLTYYPGLPGAFVGTGPDGSTRILHLDGRAHILPRLGGEGAMVDLSLVNRVTDPARSDSQDEVWLSPGAHPKVLAALARDHIRVTDRVSLASVEKRYSSEAPAKSAQLGLAVGAGALLLTFLGVIAIRIIGAAARRRDWDSLRTAGVPGRLLRSALTIETLVPIGLAVVLGAAAGVVAFVLTVPHLPLTTGDGVVPPPDYSLAPLPLTAIVVGALVLVAVIAVVGARLELQVRRSR
jgi:putative ABC transport system permease protein